MFIDLNLDVVKEVKPRPEFQTLDELKAWLTQSSKPIVRSKAHLITEFSTSTLDLDKTLTLTASHPVLSKVIHEYPCDNDDVITVRHDHPFNEPCRPTSNCYLVEPVALRKNGYHSDDRASFEGTVQAPIRRNESTIAMGIDNNRHNSNGRDWSSTL
jgi:hypothetical protein